MPGGGTMMPAVTSVASLSAIARLAERRRSGLSELRLTSTFPLRCTPASDSSIAW
jgi:hypothetical protein